MSRIRDAFRRADREKRAAFVPYVTAGDPNLARTIEIARALERAGADVLELGVPFSDPMADGPTNQRAAERALEAKTTLSAVLATVSVLRQDCDLPIVLFTYANPVVRYGLQRFSDDAVAAGVDGVLFTDVPAEEMAPFEEMLGPAGLDLIMLVTPTSGAATFDVTLEASGMGIFDDGDTVRISDGTNAEIFERLNTVPRFDFEALAAYFDAQTAEEDATLTAQQNFKNSSTS